MPKHTFAGTIRSCAKRIEHAGSCFIRKRMCKRPTRGCSRAGEPVRNAIMSTDSRARDIIDEWTVVDLTSIAASRAKLRWEFSEELVVEGAAEHLGEMLREVPHVFQELTLQSATCELSEGGLSMALRLERVAAAEEIRRELEELIEQADYLLSQAEELKIKPEELGERVRALWATLRDLRREMILVPRNYWRELKKKASSLEAKVRKLKREKRELEKLMKELGKREEKRRKGEERERRRLAIESLIKSVEARKRNLWNRFKAMLIERDVEPKVAAKFRSNFNKWFEDTMKALRKELEGRAELPTLEEVMEMVERSMDLYVGRLAAKYGVPPEERRRMREERLPPELRAMGWPYGHPFIGARGIARREALMGAAERAPSLLPYVPLGIPQPLYPGGYPVYGWKVIAELCGIRKGMTKDEVAERLRNCPYTIFFGTDITGEDISDELYEMLTDP